MTLSLNLRAQFTKQDTIKAIAIHFSRMPMEELINEKNYIVYIQRKVNSDSLISLRADHKNIDLFLANFWYEYGSSNFLEIREEYLGRIILANKLFSMTGRAGYLTNRGRILMTFGHPNDKNAVKNQSNCKPYEIWFYNKINNGQSNIEFVFYNESRMINDYTLIHSNARGELMNVSWKNMIYYKDAPDMHKGDYQFFDAPKRNAEF